MLPEELIIVALTRVEDADGEPIPGFSKATFGDGTWIVAEDALLGEDATWRDWKLAVDQQVVLPPPPEEDPDGR